MMAKPKYDHGPLTREDECGPLRLMAIVEGYVIVRRKGAIPFVVSIGAWVKIGPDRPVANLRAVGGGSQGSG